MIRVRRPSDETLAALRERCADAPFSYAPIGVTEPGVPTPPGFRRERWTTELGHGADVFDAAAATVLSWGMQRGAGLAVVAGGPPVTGDVVAMAAPLPVGWIDVTCRVIAVIDEPDRRGFVYGTLPIHPETGEESFAVVRHADGTVALDIVAVSRSSHPLSRLAPPIARRLQASAVGRYQQAVRAAL
jgi:uncharacterized protein (UPF0548 family)